MPGTPVAEDAAGDDPSAATDAADIAAHVADLSARLAEAEAKAAAARDAQLRAIADLDNVRKRAEREITSAGKYQTEKLLGELLGVADSLDLGLAAADNPDAQVSTITQGLALTLRQLLATLEKHGVKQVDPQGQAFNPDLHEAVTMMESQDVLANHVLKVMQKGYRLHERLLRPAMVVVAKAPAAARESGMGNG